MSHLKTAILRKAADVMDPVAVRMYQQQKAYLQDPNIPAARKALIRVNVNRFEAEKTRRQKHGLTDKTLTQQYQTKQHIQNDAMRVAAEARRAGKPEAVAIALGKAHAAKLGEKYVRGEGFTDMLTAGGRAKDMSRFSGYMKGLPAGQPGSYIDPKHKQAFIEKHLGYQLVRMPGQYTKFLGAAQPKSINPKIDLRSAGQQSLDRIDATARKQFDTVADLDTSYANETAGAYDKYKTERNAKVGGFLKNNWGKIAGIGLGLGGLMMMRGMRNDLQNMRGGYGGQQPTQKPAAPWFAQSNFRRNVPKPPKAPGTFTSFMNGPARS